MFGFACTGGEDESAIFNGDEFVVEGDGDGDDVDAGESGEGESGEGETTDDTDADTNDTSTGSTDDADTNSTDADTDDTTTTTTTSDTNDTDTNDGPDPCGNGLIDPGEDCDGGALGGATCVSEGFDAGVLDCNPDCSFDYSGCETIEEFCGDGILNGNEECDGADLGGLDCADLGLPAGALACEPGTCSFDDSGCAWAGDGFEGFEGNAIPAGWVKGGNANWTTTPNVKHSGSYGARAGTIGHNQTTWLEVAVQFPAGGSINFWHRPGTELNYDFVIFSIDGVDQNSWSGNYVDFLQYNKAVGPGLHTFRWTYERDFAGSSGSDTWFLDDVTVMGGNLP